MSSPGCTCVAGSRAPETLRGKVGFSHTTVHQVLSCKRLPSWGKLELVVEALGGDPETMRPLWVSARQAVDFAEPAVLPVARPTVGILVAHVLDARPLYSVISSPVPVAVDGDPNVYRTGVVASADPERARRGGGGADAGQQPQRGSRLNRPDPQLSWHGVAAAAHRWHVRGDAAGGHREARAGVFAGDRPGGLVALAERMVRGTWHRGRGQLAEGR